MPAAGGEPARLVSERQRIFGLTWTADGRGIVYSSAKWEWSDAVLWRVSPWEGSPPALVQLRERAWLPSVSRQGKRLAFTQRVTDTNIWQIRAPGGLPQQEGAVRLIASTQQDASPALSRDGTRIAFTSDRSGKWGVWVCDRNGSNASQLTSSFEGPAGNPAWSPDGTQIAFDASIGGNTDIYVVAAAGGTARRLTADPALEYAPSWSNDGKSVYFASAANGRLEAWKIPIQGGRSVQVTKHGGHRPVESPDGAFVYYEKGSRVASEFEPWRVPVHGGNEAPVLRNLHSRWALVQHGLYFFEQASGGGISREWRLAFYEFATGRTRVVAPLQGMPLLGHRPTVSPDGRTFLYAQLDLNQTDVRLAEQFE